MERKSLKKKVATVITKGGMMVCELCNNTGWYGDNGPGIKGNNEYQRCECRIETKYKICHACNGDGVVIDSEHKGGRYA